MTSKADVLRHRAMAEAMPMSNAREAIIEMADMLARVEDAIVWDREENGDPLSCRCPLCRWLHEWRGE